jgi:large subunit ribosomal protein L17
MRHSIKLKKLNRTSAHRSAMLINMAVSLLKHEQIKTTLVKAKALRPFVEKLITKARKNNLFTRRYLLSRLRDINVVTKLVKDIGPRNLNRPGGYIKILKAGFRSGDIAPIAIMQLVEKKQITNKADKEEKNKEKVVEKETSKISSKIEEEVKATKKSVEKSSTKEAKTTKSKKIDKPAK